MNSAIERLLSLRIADVMTKKVVSISTHDSLATAAQTLQEHSISGLPVVDERNQCTGILSALDFVKQIKPTDTDPFHLLPVSRHMTSDVHSTKTNESLLTAARLMCTNHIHRLPVLDEQRHPIGMITALDIVAALVNAIEE